MQIYFEGSVGVCWVRLGSGPEPLAGPFGSIAEIKAAYPQEFAAAFPDGLDVRPGGNVTHRISTVLDGVK
jgi:hypothetical protein